MSSNRERLDAEDPQADEQRPGFLRRLRVGLLWAALAIGGLLVTALAAALAVAWFLGPVILWRIIYWLVGAEWK